MLSAAANGTGVFHERIAQQWYTQFAYARIDLSALQFAQIRSYQAAKCCSPLDSPRNSSFRVNEASNWT